jgi:hypothetical protein
MPDVAVSVSVRRPRLSLKTPPSKPAVPRQEVVPAFGPERDATPRERPRPSPAPSDDRAARIHDLLRELANAADILQAASDGIASLQKWTRVGCAIAELMREASEAFEAAKAAVSDPAPQALLGSLVIQHNTVLEQIDCVARDALRGGVNLLMGDTLTLACDETATSSLVMSGSVCDAASLGLAPLAADTDLAPAAETVLGALRAANAALRTQAQTMTAHLLVVRSRQQFFANLQGMLDVGTSPARAATASEEAANSFALSTRQAIATSALALAQESQTSILRLLNRSNFFGQGN